MTHGSFGLTRRQARGMAEALRKATWATGIAGDYSLTLAHPNGTEVTIDVRLPQRSVPAIVVRGFRPQQG
jgi:hypothetical protein